MSQQSNPATLREAATEAQATNYEIAVDLLRKGILAMKGKARTAWADDVRQFLGYMEHVDKVAASGTEAAPSDKDSATFNDGYSEGYQNGCIDTENRLRTPTKRIIAGGEYVDVPAAASPEGEGREAGLREALKSSMVALDDWLNIHASDLCDEQRVKEARQRVNEHGTIHYIGTVQDRNRAALRQSAAPSGGAVDVEWVNEALKYAGEGRTNTIKPDLLANAINKRFRLAQESKTGAVTETK